MIRYLSLAIHFLASLISYTLLSLQRYTLNYPMVVIVMSILLISIFVSIKYLLKYRESLLKLVAIFIVFIYVSAAERAFILISTLSGWEIYIGIIILLFITLDIAILFYYILRGKEERITKMDYKGYA